MFCFRVTTEAGEDGEDSDEFGDFEDLETGTKYSGGGDEAVAAAVKAMGDVAAEERRAKKLAKRAEFDASLDKRELRGMGGCSGAGLQLLQWQFEPRHYRINTWKLTSNLVCNMMILELTVSCPGCL